MVRVSGAYFQVVAGMEYSKCDDFLVNLTVMQIDVKTDDDARVYGVAEMKGIAEAVGEKDCMDAIDGSCNSEFHLRQIQAAIRAHLLGNPGPFDRCLFVRSPGSTLRLPAADMSRILVSPQVWTEFQ